MTTVSCQAHGRRRLVAVCQHVVQQLQDGTPRGAAVDYFEDDDSFQGLCTACERLVRADPAGVPPDAKAAMGHHVICEECMNLVLVLNGKERLS